jgi:hypothetical protein
MEIRPVVPELLHADKLTVAFENFRTPLKMIPLHGIRHLRYCVARSVGTVMEIAL